tara:strand:- start:1243 stop:2196 length:954 start_codon:yes stop_codon:yes gene_type:complete
MYKTPKLKNNYIPADWNEGNTPVELSGVQIENCGVYIRDIEDISSRLLDKYNAQEFKIKLFPGSDIAIFTLFSLLSSDYDKIYLFNEDYKQVAFFARILFKEVFFINGLDEAIENMPKDAVLYFSNPGNPSCKYYNSHELSNKLPKDIVSVIDLAYVDYHENFDYVDFDGHENIFFVKTCSKFYGLASIRIGMLFYNTSISNLDDALEAVNSKWIGEAQYNALALVIDFDDDSLRIRLNERFLDFERYLVNHVGADCNIYKAGNFFRLDFHYLNKKQEFLNFMDSNSISVRDLGHIKTLNKSVRINYRDELYKALHI